MPKAGKIWGETTLLLSEPGIIEMHALVILPNAYCSVHSHRHKWNAFLVTEGVLHVHVVQQAYALTDVTTLRSGELMTVPPGVDHFFKTGSEGARCVEVYYPPGLQPGDIIRRDVGGKL